MKNVLFRSFVNRVRHARPKVVLEDGGLYEVEPFCWGETIALTGSGIEYFYSSIRVVYDSKIEGLVKALLSFTGKLTFTFGADPECELSTSDGFIYAGDVVNGDLESYIGLDGCRDTAELRPMHEKSSSDLVENIEELLKDVAYQYGDYYWSVSSDYVPLGGHIHIGCEESSSVIQSGWIVNYLDFVFGKRLLKLAGRARKRSGYNKPGSWRDQDWGIEYRTPPAVWLHNRDLTEAVLRLTELICEKLADGIPVDTEGVMTYKEIARQFGLEVAKKLSSGIQKYKKGGKDIVSSWGLTRRERTRDIVLSEEWDDDRRRAFYGVRIRTRSDLRLIGAAHWRGDYRVISGSAIINAACRRYGMAAEDTGANSVLVSRDIRVGIYRHRFINFLFALADVLDDCCIYDEEV